MSKDKRWLVQNDPGILRKKADPETDLFIFGYACKIFRDDQKALEMDQGKHLIPWMGEETLKIDRYDARGHLSELSQFEATNQDYVLTSEERRIEQICDEERYRALHHNEEEQEMYQEEELKRLKQALSSDKEYRQVAYQYDNDGAPPPLSSEPEANPEDGEPFTPSPTLVIPANMKLPSTVKENQIIEKTAAHIASHGPQVEILIKTRQANNQKLNFLHVGSPLNPYYNFILSQIKLGRYKPAFMIQQEAEMSQENEHYLHPSLAPAPSTTVESAPSIPSIAYKPSSDCFYNLLVNKIRNMQQTQSEGVSEVGEPSTSGDSPPSRRRRRKRLSSQPHLSNPAVKQIAVPPENVREIISRLINFAHSRDLHPSEIASSLLEKDSKNLGFVEPTHKYYDYYVQQVQETYKENIYNLSNPLMEAADSEEPNSFDPVNTYDPETPTEEDLEHSIPVSGDFPLSQESSGGVPPSVEDEGSITASEYDVPNQPSTKPSPVCFSIKKPKETERLEHVSAFPLEETSSDEEGKEQGEHSSVTQETDKEKSCEGDIISISNSVPVVDESVKSPVKVKSSAKSAKEKEQSSKNNIKSPGSANSVIEVILVSSQTSSEGGRKSTTSDDSRKTYSSDSSKKTTSSSDSRKSYSSSDTKRSSSSTESKKGHASSDSKRSQKMYTSSESRKSLTSTSSERSRKTETPSDRRTSLTESGRKSISDSSKKNKERKSSRKYKYSSSSADKFREQEKAKKRLLDGKSYREFIPKMRRESDDLPPLPEDPIPEPSVPGENLEKKREERKKKVKEMIEKIKTESLGLQENSQSTLKAGTAPTLDSSDVTLNFKSLLPQAPFSLVSNQSNNKAEELKKDSQKDLEEQLKQQVKQSLKKIAETTLAAIPPISEDSCSQFDHSSAANSNGFETPTSCGRPIFRVSRTPSIGIVEGTMVESSSRSSSTVSRKSHKKKKHHKKKKKRKGHSKKKRYESESESSSEDESSNDGSSSDSEPQHKKRHKKHSKSSHKKRKRKHHRHSSSSSSSSD